MKITPKQYAILLYELTKDAKKKDIEKRTRDFLNLLLKNRALNQLPKILLFYGQYYNAQENAVDVEIVTARKIVVAGLQPALRSLKAAATMEIRERVDSSVLGGARIRVGDYMIDDTLKARLRELRSKL